MSGYAEKAASHETLIDELNTDFLKKRHTQQSLLGRVQAFLDEPKPQERLAAAATAGTSNLLVDA